MRIICCVLAVLTSFASKSQTNAFTGNWSLDNMESISGKFYKNGVPEKVGILDGKDFYILEKTTQSAGKNVTSKDSILIDHPLTLKTNTGRKKIALARKLDNASFETTIQLFSPSDESVLEYISIDHWMIEKGKLILVRKMTNQLSGEEWEMQAIYNRDSR